jgi:hypothetical protein
MTHTTNKTIFIVDSWVPFPSSEYGGVQIVIADDEAEAVKLIAEAEMEFEKKNYPDYVDRIKVAVHHSIRFPVHSSVSELVYAFVT